MPIENVFSWSKSRDEQFKECLRKYYYDKYASWGGWDAQAPQEARMAYVLKNLKNRWAWKGETVHHLIEDVLKALRDRRPMTEAEALSRLTEVMRRDYLSSKGKKYFENPKLHRGLFEHEYAKSVSDADWKKLHDSCADCLRSFFGSALYAELIQDDKANWLVIEDLEEYDFDGVKVYVKLDFARRKNGFIEIYDWKTGKADGEGAALQMAVYALYAMSKWKVSLESVRAYLVSLSGTASPEPQSLTSAMLEEARRRMKESIDLMHGLLLDPAKNLPKAKESFTFTSEDRLCGWCNFYRICEKYQPVVR